MLEVDILGRQLFLLFYFYILSIQGVTPQSEMKKTGE